ncbi:DNA helicase PIF1, ATP-dependent [Corchorus olitorius]|uniref:ATP-dependent DNA helicase n=1 Tax=Corchorus olitorius TaxID=93759 RepID=A0A1R3I5V7_9ROSI|nr:DNA helicase PIF1, ATP-dependent [Corchorus olitorius]
MPPGSCHCADTLSASGQSYTLRVRFVVSTGVLRLYSWLFALIILLHRLFGGISGFQVLKWIHYLAAVVNLRCYSMIHYVTTLSMCLDSHAKGSQFRSSPSSNVHSSISYPLEVGCIAQCGPESSSVLSQVLFDSNSDSLLDDASLIDVPVSLRTVAGDWEMVDVPVVLVSSLPSQANCTRSIQHGTTPKRSRRKADSSSVTLKCLKPRLSGRILACSRNSCPLSRMLAKQNPVESATTSVHPPPERCPTAHDVESFESLFSQCPPPSALAGFNRSSRAAWIVQDSLLPDSSQDSIHVGDSIFDVGVIQPDSVNEPSPPSSSDTPSVSQTIPSLLVQHTRKINEAHYFGSPDITCQFCGACMWMEESVKRKAVVQFPFSRSAADRACSADSVNRLIVEGLMLMLDNVNEVVKIFRTAREKIDADGSREVRIRDTGLQHISTVHPLYMALQCPLLFPYGEDGFTPHINYVSSPVKALTIRTTMSMRDYYSYQLQQRASTGETLLRGGRLFQQFCVDAFSSVQEGELHWLDNHQKEIMADLYTNVRDLIKREDVDVSGVGKRIVLPASFTGGPRYPYQKYQDAMAICRAYGYPDLFITFTCNGNRQELKDAIGFFLGLRPEDQPDLVARVFHIKLRSLIDDLMKHSFFGPALVATCAHLLWLQPGSMIVTVSDIDKIVSTELPDKDTNPVAYEAVTSLMMHGPCGAANPKASCMKKNRCDKHFPKMFNSETRLDALGYHTYRRRATDAICVNNGVVMDNHYVVPHNVDLIIRYQAHINVEVCNQSRAIKYLFKYINKGPNRASVVIESHDFSTSPACWRIFSFDIHLRQPAVLRLLVHLRGRHHVYVNSRQSPASVLSKRDADKTMFTEWLVANSKYEAARQLLYVDFPIHFVWHPKEKTWEPRQRGRTIGRVIQINALAGFCIREIRGDPTFVMADADLRDHVLLSVDDMLHRFGSSLVDKNIPLPRFDLHQPSVDRLLLEVMTYDVTLLELEHASLLSSLNPQQLAIYDSVVESIDSGGGKDEAPTMHRNCIEALDRSLKDVHGAIDPRWMDQPFGGITVVFSGDFRQIMPVIPGGSRYDIVNFTICNSPLWRHCHIMHLTTNMRLLRTDISDALKVDIASFGNWLIDVGDGKVPSVHTLDDRDGALILLPDDLMVPYTGDPVQAIISEVYPDFVERFNNKSYLSQRAIITPYNPMVDQINSSMLELIPRTTRNYYSFDKVSNSFSIANGEPSLYPIEFLNGITSPGTPPHRLRFKIGCIVMLLRNINQMSGLCNGTRLMITSLGRTVMEGVAIAGDHVGQRFFIPRIVFVVENRQWHFILVRRQFPLRICYAMTINKSHKSRGQNLDHVGLYLPKPVFTHGQRSLKGCQHIIFTNAIFYVSFDKVHLGFVLFCPSGTFLFIPYNKSSFMPIITLICCSYPSRSFLRVLSPIQLNVDVVVYNIGIHDKIVWISIAILICLFMVQRYGTDIVVNDVEDWMIKLHFRSSVCSWFNKFLSMKLATVNPMLGFSIEGLLGKVIIQTRAGPSSTLRFSPKIAQLCEEAF